jgi:hypothetical protein
MSINPERFISNSNNAKPKPHDANNLEFTGVSAMDGESVERLMDIILQMRINLQQVVVTFQQQSEEIREQLGAIFDEERKALEGCLGSIDGKLRECAAHVEDYKRLYSSLSAMRQKLVQLGAEPAAMPGPLPLDQIGEIILWRLQQLKCNGRV